MSQDEREAYERESFEELKRRVSVPGRSHHVQEVRLVGEYPETAILVRWLDTRDNRERERAYHLWISPVTKQPPGNFEYHGTATVGREPPSEVAMLIKVHIEEN